MSYGLIFLETIKRYMYEFANIYFTFWYHIYMLVSVDIYFLIKQPYIVYSRNLIFSFFLPIKQKIRANAFLKGKLYFLLGSPPLQKEE